MTDAGWHPDPHGRADRRYHDGTGWTAHVADADGTASRDPHGAGAEPQAPPAAPVIGPPPPRSSPAPAPAAADPGHTQQISATDLPPPPADPADALDRADPADGPDDGPGAATVHVPAGPAAEPAPGPAAVPPDHAADLPVADLPVADLPVARADRTQQLSAADLAAATSLAKAAGNTDHTVQMSAEEVAAAAALASASPPPVEARQGPHTEPISTQDLTAAAAALAAGEGRPDGDRVRTRPRPIAVVGALLGIGLAGAGLLLLPWATAGGTDASYLDVRDAVDTLGSGDSAATTAFVITGALFAVGVGGIVALARAIGAAPVRAVAAVVALLGAGGLAVLGYAAIDVEGGAATASGTEVIDPDAGSPVTLPDGTPVTDPSTGSAVTVPEGGIDPGQVSEEALADVFTAEAEDRMTDAAIVGAVLLALAGLLALVGLGLRGTAGHVVTAVGLLVVAGWAIVALLGLRDAGDVGTGPTVLVAGTVVLALSAVVPGRRRPPDPAPEAP